MVGNALGNIGVWSTSALASNGFDTNCEGVTDELPAPEIPAPSLTIKVADHGPSTADADEEAGSDETANTVNVPLGTVLRLPGVSDEDLPRFRRQMFRTDI